MTTNHRDLVLNGAQAASRLHQEFRTRQKIEDHGGSIDIFGTIKSLGIPLILKPLDGMLGAYLTNPAPGIIVTTKRRMAVQRLTAAHELGHARADHNPSLDEEEILLRAIELQPTSPSSTGYLQEIEADAFAIAFLTPQWLINWHADQQKWCGADFEDPHIVYQLSLRIGASYSATCRILSRYRFISVAMAQQQANLQPREFKRALLEDYSPPHFRGDVWNLTEKDLGLRIEGSRDDHFVLKLHEHSGSGYMWNIDQLKKSGFAVVSDVRKPRATDVIGGSVVRTVIARPNEPTRGTVKIDERRPWLPESSLMAFILDYDFTGPETEGLSRAEHRAVLEIE